MKSEYQNTIINKIRQLRQEKGMSQFQIATALGISTGQLGNIETPARPHKYTLAQLAIICEELGIQIVDLFLEDKSDLPTDVIINRLINSIIEYEK